MVDGSQGTEPSGAVSLVCCLLGAKFKLFTAKKVELTLPWLFLAIPAGVTLQEQAGGKPNSSPLSKKVKYFTSILSDMKYFPVFPPWSMQGVVGTGADPSLSCSGGAQHTTAGS